MSRVKYETCKAIADALSASGEVALLNRVKTIHRPPTEAADYPDVCVMPWGRWRAQWWYEDEVKDPVTGEPIIAGPNSDQALVEVGELVGTIRLWIAAHYPTDRETLEDAVLRAFNAIEGVPGRLDVTLPSFAVGTVDTGHEACVSAVLRDESWNEEQAFSEKRWAELDLDVEVPILILRQGAPRIEEYRLCFSRDITTDISGAATPADAVALLGDVEDYSIDEDGNITEI